MHYKRKKPKDKKGFTWGHRPEPDPEPEVSKTGPVSKKKKKNWVITGYGMSFRGKREGRRVYGRYHTEASALQAMEAMRKHDENWEKMFPNSQYWSNRKYKVEYRGKDVNE